MPNRIESHLKGHTMKDITHNSHNAYKLTGGGDKATSL